MAARPEAPDASWLWANEPCRAACPVNTDAGAYVTAIAEGRFEDAYLIARAPNPFPSVCGRVCAAPCERACRRGSVDAPVSIRALKRFVTERYGVESFAANATWHQAHGDVPEATGKSVGVIGGGPAGLAAACDLRLAGHPVTVYEAQEQLGGMMVLGIPEYRLPRALIAREIEAIVELGIDVVSRRPRGRNRHARRAARRGTTHCSSRWAPAWRRDLDLPGHELDGIMRAVEYLLNVNQGFHVELGEKVVVVGGGNVAFDAARTALRAAALHEHQPEPTTLGSAASEDARRAMTTTLDVARSARRAGVLDVTVIALESPDEIPADPEEIEEAEAEGIKIVFRRGPQRFVGTDRVTGLETIAVASVFDADGRFSPTFTPNTEEVVPADTVILAVGQQADVSFAGNLERTRAGGVQVDPGTLRTSHPKIWAGGDVAKGPRNLIDAIADGRRAAASIHAELGGAPVTDRHEVRVELRTGFRRLDSDYDAIERQPIPATPTARRVGFGEVETGYDEHAARLEGLRCLRCYDNVMLSPELCILCGLCVDVCPPGCITIVRADRLGAGNEQQSALLLDEDLCIRCGLCVNRCPPSALSMVHAKELIND